MRDPYGSVRGRRLPRRGYSRSSVPAARKLRGQSGRGMAWGDQSTDHQTDGWIGFWQSCSRTNGEIIHVLRALQRWVHIVVPAPPTGTPVDVFLHVI